MKKGKGYNPENDVKWLLNESHPQKVDKFQRRLVEYILAGRNTQEKEKRIVEITCQLERLYWKSEKRTKPISDFLLRKISEALFKHRALDVFLLALSIHFKSMTREKFVTSGLNLEAGTFLPEDLELHARAWFTNEFSLFAGEAIDRAVPFALFLLEKVYLDLKKIADNRLEEVSISLKDHGSLSRTAWLVILYATTTRTHQEIPIRHWLITMLKAAEQDRVVRDVLDSVISAVTWSPDNYSKVVIDDRPVLDSVMEMLVDGLNFKEQLKKTPTLQFSKEEYKIFCRYQEILKNEREVAIEKTNRILEWFAHNIKSLRAILERKRQAVVEDTRRGLRTDGIDHFDVTVVALRTIGVRSIIFRPEKSSDPQTIPIQVIVRKEVPHCIVYTGRLNNLHLELDEDALYNAWHKDLRLLSELLEFIIIDILHRIMVEERELRPRPSTAKGGADRPKTIPVRPMVRRLPAGYKPSYDAIARAQEVRVAVPSGYTFIRAYWRSGALAYDLPTEPIGVYSDDDLFEAGGGK